VLACVFFLAVLILPAFGGTTGAKSKALQCLQNQRQIMAAMLMYTQDNNDFMPPNPDDGNTVSGHNWCPGQAGTGGANEYDPDILSDERYSLLAVYLKGQTGLYQCPADPRPQGRASGSSSKNPAYADKFIPPARTVSMSGAVGTVCATFKNGGSGHGANQPPVYPVDGPWLNNSHSHKANQPWHTYGKLSNVSSPGPAMVWVTLDENVLGLNDAGFAVGMNTATWIDFVGYYHGNAAGFSFLDGHSEIHKWIDSRTVVTKPGTTQVPASNPLSRDWLWISQHTSGKG